MVDPDKYWGVPLRISFIPPLHTGNAVTKRPSFSLPRRAYPFSPRGTSHYRNNQESLDESSEDEQRERDHEVHRDRMPDLASGPFPVTLTDSPSEHHAEPQPVGCRDNQCGDLYSPVG